MYAFNLDQHGLKTVGIIPTGLPSFHFPTWNFDLVQKLLPAHLWLRWLVLLNHWRLRRPPHCKSVMTSITIRGWSLCGLANIAAGINGICSFRKFVRTVVNSDAGAKTPMSGVMSSLLMIAVSLYFTSFSKSALDHFGCHHFCFHLETGLIPALFETWKYSKGDGLAMWATFFGVTCIDISTGLVIGIILTFILLLWRISRPHIAVIGLVEGYSILEMYPAMMCLPQKQSHLSVLMRTLTFSNAHVLGLYHHGTQP